MSLGYFETYEAAYAYAQKYADESGLSLYVRKQEGPLEREWCVGFLPRRENRYGWERQVQAVEPSKRRVEK